MTESRPPSRSPQVESLADQLERGFYGGAWHGPALREVLEGMDEETACRRACPTGKSPWELVRHLAAWNEIAARRIQGEAPDTTGDQDWPPVTDTSAAAWEAAVAELEANHRKLYCAVRGLEDARLDDAVAGSDPTVRGLLLGTLQHNSYHAGQIALLKKGCP